MRLRVQHETIYRYEAPVSYGIQYARLTPRSGPSQQVLSWKLSTPGRARLWTDSFGNRVSVLVMERRHDELRIVAGGEVETVDTGGVLPDDGAAPPATFLRPTPLTTADQAVRDLAEPARAGLADDPGAALAGLMNRLRDAVEYRAGTTAVTSTAAEVAAAGTGVCQDHTHLFLACARSLGVPARYVSGYVTAGGPDGQEMASHAWAEAWIDGVGWRSFDVSNRTAATPGHIRLAVGLDYADAGPIRGVRRGGGGETMDVHVQVAASQTQQSQTQQSQQ